MTSDEGSAALRDDIEEFADELFESSRTYFHSDEPDDSDQRMYLDGVYDDKASCATSLREILDDHQPTSTDEPFVNCELCEDVNVSNAVMGVVQMVACDDNSISSIDEAVEIVRRRANEYMSEEGGDDAVDLSR